MEASTLLGVAIVALAGLCMGSGGWTLKALRQFKVEHWLFIAMLVGLVLIPWTVTLIAFPHALAAYREVGLETLLLANVFAFGWGIANVLCSLCFVRIGIALTGAVLGGLGLSLGVTIPMVFKASGLFEDAADLISPAGATILGGVGVMLVAVTLVALAGFGRDRVLKAAPESARQPAQTSSGSFLVGLIMAIVSGILSTGPNFVFAYSQDAIVSRVCLVRPGQTITVRVAGSSQLARGLSKEYLVRATGSMSLGPPVGAVKVAGLAPEQVAPQVAAALKASRVFREPQVKVVSSAGGGVIQSGQTVRLKVVEAAGGTACVVGADGRVTLDVIGAVEVGGQSAFQARAAIAAAVKAKGVLLEPSVAVDTHNLLAPFPVWTVGMLSGALVNLLFPLWLMRQNKTWHLWRRSGREIVISAIAGVQFFVAIVLLGGGSLKLGALGASVGWGIYQAMQTIGGQAVGFLSGEWRAVYGKPRRRMYLAIALLLLGAMVIAYGNSRPKL